MRAGLIVRSDPHVLEVDGGRTRVAGVGALRWGAGGTGRVVEVVEVQLERRGCAAGRERRAHSRTRNRAERALLRSAHKTPAFVDPPPDNRLRRPDSNIVWLS